MPNRTLFILAYVVLPCFVCLITAGIFWLFMPAEPSPLFYTNLAVTLWLEVVCFGYLGLLKAKTQGFTAPLFAFIGVGAAYYILCAGAWMLLYSFLLPEAISCKAYIVVHVVMLLIWIIVGTLVAQQDNAYYERTEQLRQDNKTIDFFIQEMNVLYARYRDILSSKDAGLREESDSMEILRNKMRGLAAPILQNGNAKAQLSAILDEANTLIASLESAETPEEVRKQNFCIQQHARRSVNELDLLKQLSKK